VNEVKPSERCPCNSGKRYRDCCKKKAFKWAKDGEGGFHRVVPLGDKAVRVLDDFEADYKRVFGRIAREDDPISLAKYLVSPEDMRREMLDAMKQTQIRPEIEYAYRKTGFLLTKENEALLPDSDVAEWDAAVDEFFDLKKKTVKEHEFVDKTRWLVNAIDDCVIALGYLLEAGPTDKYVPVAPPSKYASADGYVLFCGASTFRVLRSISLLIDKDRTAEALALTRIMLEAYLHIVFVKKYPEKVCDLVDAVIGLKAGTHAYQRNKKGGEVRRVIVHQVSGEMFEGHISGFRMAQSSELPEDIEIYDYFYDSLSGLVHPDFGEIGRITDDEGALDLMKHEEPIEPSILALTFGSLVLDELRKLSVIDGAVARDALFVIERVRDNVVTFLKQYLDPKGEDRAMVALCKRLVLLGQ
jgi:hypothetical protein